MVEVKSPRTIILSMELSGVHAPSNETIENIMLGTTLGSSVLRKQKKTLHLSHKSLEDVLAAPSFTQANGCLSPKCDRAMSLTLLSAFKSLEIVQDKVAAFALKKNITAATTIRRLIRRFFREGVMLNLKQLGIESPLIPLKDGGVVGNETLSFVTSKFLVNMGGRVRQIQERVRGAGTLIDGKLRSDNLDENFSIPHNVINLQCPATVSVIGAITAQEAIKACTNIHTPISQALMFESLESLHLSSEALEESIVDHDSFGDRVDMSLSRSLYGDFIARNLADMKVFVVGAGAIGCELLKTMALMGISTGRGEMVITDMDDIERSNLNRQLLFREQHLGRY